MSAPVGTNLHHQVDGLNALAAELDNFAKKTGQTWTDKDGNTIDSRHYLQQQLQQNPGLMGSIDQWRRTAAGGSTEPDNQILDKMSADPKSQAARGDLIQLFGGADKLQKYKVDREAQTAAAKTGAEAAARATAEAATPEGQQKLQNEKLTGEDKQLDIAKKKQDAALLGGDSTLSGQAYLDSLPPESKSLITSLGTGHIALSRLDYLAARKPDVLEAVTRAYPDFDSSKVKSYLDTYHDFTAGKTSDILTRGATALMHLRELADLNTVESRIPGTSDYQRYENKVDTVAPELGAFYGNSTEQGIASYKKTLNAILNRGAAIRTQAQSMGDRFDSYEQKWKNAAPSAAYQAPLPSVSAAVKKARADLDPEYAKRLQGEAIYASAPGKPRMMSNDGGKTWQPAQ